MNVRNLYNAAPRICFAQKHKRDKSKHKTSNMTENTQKKALKSPKSIIWDINMTKGIKCKIKVFKFQFT